MNKLKIEDRAKVISCLVEGNSIRSTVRMTGVSKNTVSKLLVDIGRACTEYQDKAFRNLKCKRIQCDEIWSFVGNKEKNTSAEKKAKGNGDCWTGTALCPDTKLVPCWFIGTRDAGAAYHFMHDLAGRLASRVQMTTDGLKLYVQAAEDAFGAEIDYAQLVKIYGNEGVPKDNAQIRYSPAQCMGARKAVISGQPSYKHISTSHTERQNLSMRMGMRRFTRLTNAFSKKLENHEHAVALYFMYYTLRLPRIDGHRIGGIMTHQFYETNICPRTPQIRRNLQTRGCPQLAAERQIRRRGGRGTGHQCELALQLESAGARRC